MVLLGFLKQGFDVQLGAFVATLTCDCLSFGLVRSSLIKGVKQGQFILQLEKHLVDVIAAGRRIVGDV